MAELHLVGTSDDGRHLLLARAPTAAAEFELLVDERLTALLRTGRRPADSASALSPRQIQAELRAGSSVDEVAAHAGVPVERLEPYAAPVLSELSRVVEDALAARMSRPQQGPSALPLGSAVLTHLAGADGTGPAPHWSARRDHDATWVVEMRRTGNPGATVARWRWDRVARSLAPLDAVAAELGHVGPGGVQPRPEAPAAASTAVPVSDEPVSAPAGPDDTTTAPARRDVATEAAGRPVRSTRGGRRPAVPAWADVLLGVSAAGPAPTGTVRPEETEAAG